MARGERRGKFYQTLVDDLLIFAEHHVRESLVMADGATVREHADSAARQFAALGIKPKASPISVGPPLPRPVAYLWRMFVEIMNGIASNGMAPAIVTWEALAAWSSFMRTDLRPWEALALVRLGSLRAHIIVEQQAKEIAKVSR